MNSFCTAAAFLGMNMCDNTTAIDTAVEQSFIEHLAAFGISYGTKEEYSFRLSLFNDKDAEYKKINAEQSSFTVGHNQFSTWTKDEYKKLLGAKVDLEQSNTEVLSTANLASSVDWRAKGAVNAVKNQGQCGSCWTFSATAATEGAHFLKTGTLLSLSEQEIVDCDTTSFGCQGGW